MPGATWVAQRMPGSALVSGVHEDGVVELLRRAANQEVGPEPGHPQAGDESRQMMGVRADVAGAADRADRAGSARHAACL